MCTGKLTDYLTASVWSCTDSELTHDSTPGKQAARLMKTCFYHSKFEYYSLCWVVQKGGREGWGGGCLCSLATTHVSKYMKRGTVSPGNGGGSPFCQRGLRRQNDESQNVVDNLKQHNVALWRDFKVNTQEWRRDMNL